MSSRKPSRTWTVLRWSRVSVASGVAVLVVTTTFADPKLGFTLFLALSFPLLAIGHLGLVLFRCPRCDQPFAFSGEWMEDSFLATFRGYFGWRCARCRTRVGSSASDDHELMK